MPEKHVFRGVDVGVLLEQAVSDVKDSVPRDITSVEIVESELASVCKGGGVSNLKESLDDLFQWKRIRRGVRPARGFPGVVLTAIVGRLVDPQYDPSVDFYGISPRTLFERHIGPVLRDKYHAPMGKSDPLNVAKNISRIDAGWAEGRRPQYAAEGAVTLVEWVTDASQEELRALLRVMVWCYLSLSQLYTRDVPRIDAGIDLTGLQCMLIALIEEAPAGGATAQAVTGALLKAQHELFDLEGSLEGVGESVYTTNTTSGKPGDFCETLSGHLHIYEVTTKKVDWQRLGESAHAIQAYLGDLAGETPLVEATFLCNLSSVVLKDLAAEGICRGPLDHAGVRYYFLDLPTWILLMLERLGPSGREIALGHVVTYIGAPTTELKVKDFWEERVSSMSDATPE